jgi:7-cyano-7-deazaguanine synthase
MNLSTDSALVLFSGGQDSTTCLAWALSRYSRVETLGFDYRQRHAVELTVRPAILESIVKIEPSWLARLGADHVLDLSVLGAVSDTALTRECEITMQANGLPNTFVPGRNLVFLTLAAALAYRRGISVIVGGMCETDYSGYPDCRDETLRTLQTALQLGMDTKATIETPLMWLDKAATWSLADQLGGASFIELIRTATHTCYLGERGELHEWGYGCGQCPACELRATGYYAYRTNHQAND